MNNKTQDENIDKISLNILKMNKTKQKKRKMKNEGEVIEQLKDQSKDLTPK